MGKHSLENSNKIKKKPKKDTFTSKNKTNKKTANKFGKLVLLLIQIIFIIILMLTGIEIVKWVIDKNVNSKIMENIAQSIIVVDNENNVNDSEDNNKKYEVDFRKLKETNNEIVAWIKVNNTKIEYPVVQASDNSFYLTHNFERNSNKAGWVFADYRNEFDGSDKNIIIYGHNMRDDSMFGSLKNIINKEWYDNEENKYITFITETENVTYEVFSVYQIEKEDYYITTNFSGNEFNEFLSTIKSRSIKNFNVDISKQDNILTLSTCANNNKYRVVLHAKKIQ